MGDQIPDVSVVMPVYGGGKYLRDAVCSILRQSFLSLELIVVDDGSPESVDRHLKAFRDGRVRFVRLEQNGGYGRAMQAGVALARGRYIARADSDDLSHRKRIESEVEFLETNIWAAFVGTRRWMISPHGRRLGTTRWPEGAGPWIEITWDSLMQGERLFADASVIVKRAAIDEVGGWRDYQRTGMDVDLWLRLLEKGFRGAVLRTPLYFRRLHPEGLIFSENTSVKNQLIRELARERALVGTDAVMRGEAINPVAQECKSCWEIRRRQGAFAWSIGAQCLEEADFCGGFEFAKAAIVRGGLAGVLTRGPLRFVRAFGRGARRVVQARTRGRGQWYEIMAGKSLP